MPAFDDDVCELYAPGDWTQAHDLASEQPEKLPELRRLLLYGPRDSEFTGTVRWVQIDVDAASEDVDHLIGPQDRLTVAMVREPPPDGAMPALLRRSPPDVGRLPA
jgi:hypothetical protein